MRHAPRARTAIVVAQHASVERRAGEMTGEEMTPHGTRMSSRSLRPTSMAHTASTAAGEAARQSRTEKGIPVARTVSTFWTLPHPPPRPPPSCCREAAATLSYELTYEHVTMAAVGAMSPTTTSLSPSHAARPSPRGAPCRARGVRSPTRRPLASISCASAAPPTAHRRVAIAPQQPPIGSSAHPQRPPASRTGPCHLGHRSVCAHHSRQLLRAPAAPHWLA